MNRLKRSLERHAPEKALLTGRMPLFVTQRGGTAPSDEVPVFVFHEVEPERLEIQLCYLRTNSYRSLDADELDATIRRGVKRERSVALTFDDATWTFWTYAFPLLKKYGARAILFAIPGLVPEDSTPYPNLSDVWEGRAAREDLDRRGKIQSLCTWRELTIMHESGIVDIQSHSLTHARVPVSARLMDFLHPGLDTSFYANVNVPISSLDDPEHPKRALRLGAPVFESAPRMACKLRFREAPELVQAMEGYVEKHGGTAFFCDPSWRKQLQTFFKLWPAERLGRFETFEEVKAAVRRELVESRNILRSRLVGKQVQHFCYPWYVGSEMADHLAAEVGYRTLYYGLEINGQRVQTTGAPLRIRRISEAFFFRLPGDGRLSLWSIYRSFAINRVRQLIRRKGAAS